MYKDSVKMIEVAYLSPHNTFSRMRLFDKKTTMAEIIEYSLSNKDDFNFEIQPTDKYASRCYQIIIQCEDQVKVNSIYRLNLKDLEHELENIQLEVAQRCFEEMFILFDNRISKVLSASEVSILPQDHYDNKVKGHADLEILHMIQIGLLHITRNISLSEWQSDTTLADICDSALQLSELIDQIVESVKNRFK